MKYSGIGGQAVIEGVMMKNKDQYAVAVRKPDGNIEIKKEEYKGIAGKSPVCKWPLVRGVVSFIDSLILGMSTLTYSSSFYEEEDSESKGTGTEPKKESKLAGVITILISIALAVGIFVVIPWLISDYVFSKFIDSLAIRNLLEGILRLLMFIAYVSLISLMKDIKRVYMYHGAEHKCINCIEHGLELNVENVKNSSKEHKRCGTSFMLIVMCLSILLLMFIRFDARWLRMVARLALIPVIAGISYELLRFTGTHDNKFINFISRPGLWLQALTTREPDDKMIEVGIASVEAVFDWKEYIDENFKDKKDENQSSNN